MFLCAPPLILQKYLTSWTCKSVLACLCATYSLSRDPFCLFGKGVTLLALNESFFDVLCRMD